MHHGKIIISILLASVMLCCSVSASADGIISQAKEIMNPYLQEIQNERKMDEAVIEARRMNFERAKQLLNQIDPSPQNTILYLFCEEWNQMLDETPGSIKDNALSFWAKDGYGTLFELDDCLLFIPDHINEDTKYLIYFPGGLEPWTIRHDLAEEYLSKYEPNCICLFFKESFVNNIDQAKWRAGAILRGVSKETGVAPQKIAILASSNGGYTALWVATDLFDSCYILTDKIVILDMGMSWSKDVLIDADSSISLVEAGTKVYHFGRGHELYRNAGSIKFAGYDVPLINVMCQHGGHDAITEKAFRNGTFSWAIGEKEFLDPNEYELENANF